MNIGVVFPQTELGADVGAVRAYGTAVAELGYANDSGAAADPSASGSSPDPALQAAGGSVPSAPANAVAAGPIETASASCACETSWSLPSTCRAASARGRSTNRAADAPSCNAPA